MKNGNLGQNNDSPSDRSSCRKQEGGGLPVCPLTHRPLAAFSVTLDMELRGEQAEPSEVIATVAHVLWGSPDPAPNKT